MMRNLAITLVFSGISVFSMNSSAESKCIVGQTDQENIENCHDVADKTLNASYKLLINDLKKRDNGSDQAMVKAQRAWIQLRNAQCDAYRINHAAPTTINAMLCEIALTKQRTEQLNKMRINGEFF